jgi:hypothetical protein
MFRTPRLHEIEGNNMKNSQARTVLDALESIAEVLDLVLNISTLPASLDVPSIPLQEALTIMHAQVQRPDDQMDIPPGWRLVPIEPTERMISRGHHRIDFDRSQQSTFDPHDKSQRGALQAGTTCAEDVREAYQAMLAAAPKVSGRLAAGAGLLDLRLHNASAAMGRH